MPEKKDVTPYEGDTPGFNYRVKVGYRIKKNSDGCVTGYTYWRWSLFNRRWIQVDYNTAKVWVEENRVDKVGELKGLPFK